MKIRDVMTRDAKLTHPEDSLQHAAQLMKECDCCILPVAEGDRLVGMITDRDMAMRCIANGKAPDGKVREAMTQKGENMADIQVRRLPVMNRDRRLVGIVSLGDFARKKPESTKALHGIARPSSQHDQSRTAF